MFMFQVPEKISITDWHHLLSETNNMKQVENYLSYKHHVELRRRAADLQNAELKLAEQMLKDSDTAYKCLGVFSSRSDKYFKYAENYRTLLFGHPFVIDLDFDFTFREEQACFNQILNCYSKNYRHPCGFHLHLTSVNKHKEINSQFQAGLLSDIHVDLHERPFWEIFPVERLVYISPEAPPLRSYDANDIYVMGGFVKTAEETEEQYTYPKAKKLGLRVGSIPVQQYG